MTNYNDRNPRYIPLEDLDGVKEFDTVLFFGDGQDSFSVTRLRTEESDELLWFFIGMDYDTTSPEESGWMCIAKSFGIPTDALIEFVSGGMSSVLGEFTILDIYSGEIIPDSILLIPSMYGLTFDVPGKDQNKADAREQIEFHTSEVARHQKAIEEWTRFLND